MKTQSRYLTSLAHPLRVLRAGSWLGLGCLTLACAREGVDLGGGTTSQNLERGTLCAESTTLEEDVIVSNQDELDRVSGCEEIRGNLIVRIFPDADLTPLSSLRVVEGQLALGVRQGWDSIAGFGVSDRVDAEVDLIRAGWLPSLDGVQALERVGALFLRGLPDPDLRAFESLRSIAGSLGGYVRGGVILQQNQKLVNLGGFEQVAGVRSLVVTLSPAIESLNGLVPRDLEDVALYSSAALTDVSALAPLTALDNLIVYETGVTDLNAFSALESVRETVTVFGNAALVDATGLGALQRAELLHIANNPLLIAVPSFASFSAQPRVLSIRDNAALQHVVLDFVNAPTPTYRLDAFGSPTGDEVELGIDVIDVQNNERLESISVPAGLTAAKLFISADNPSLTSIDLGSLRQLGQLSIINHEQLTQVDLGELASVSFLQASNNPLLSSTTFDSVPSFAREVSGNGD